MKRALRLTSSILGICAGLLAVQHGIFEVLQGNRATGHLMIQAIGSPCQPDTAWHACYPAMTLIPSFLVTGILAMIAGLSVLIWAAVFIQRKHGALMLVLLSILMLLAGGGFVPMFIGVVAGVAGSRIDAPATASSPSLLFLAALWPWTVILMVIWLPGSWLLGHFFSQAMLAMSFFSFLFFDIALPVLAAVSAYAQDRR